MVADAFAKQGDVAAFGVQRALVDDFPGAACGRKRAPVGSQVAVAGVERGSDQTADVDLRTLAEQDAVRIDQIDLAVGVQFAHDLAAVRVGDAIDCDGGRIGLMKVDPGVAADIERLPVDAGVLAGLVHIHMGTVDVNAGLA
nr:hypothetical protein [Candidatus Methylobacter oryzae]